MTYDVRGTPPQPGPGPQGTGEPGSGTGKLVAISDLHIRYPENRRITDALWPESPADWLIVAGDIGETFEHVDLVLTLLAERFAKVVWAPGNHELWTTPDDPVQLRGEARYRRLVDLCRERGVVTPEDPYPVWRGVGGPAVVAPLFIGYDYTFRPAGTHDKTTAMARAEAAGVICTDEFMLHPDPHPTREAWCEDRLAYTEQRLNELPENLPTVLINHYPLVREPLRVLRYPEFALWCGTQATQNWPVRYRAASVVYGHLHIPRLLFHEGVAHQEVSLGYPREWQPRPWTPGRPVQILPAPVDPATLAPVTSSATGSGAGRGPAASGR